jgi:hypothetical protein
MIVATNVVVLCVLMYTRVYRLVYCISGHGRKFVFEGNVRSDLLFVGLLSWKKLLLIVPCLVRPLGTSCCFATSASKLQNELID